MTLHLEVQVAGQIWIPAVTVFIGAFTIAAVGIFQNSIALGFSYGVCVSTLVSVHYSACFYASFVSAVHANMFLCTIVIGMCVVPASLQMHQRVCTTSL